MKHNLNITVVLLAFFLFSQLLGIVILYNYIDVGKSLESGKTVFIGGNGGISVG